MGRRKPSSIPEPGLKQVNIETCLANLGKTKSEQVQIKKSESPVKMSENVMNLYGKYEKRVLPFPFPVYEKENKNKCNATKSKENNTNTPPTQSKVTILSNKVISPAKDREINKKNSDSSTADQPAEAANLSASRDVETSDKNEANNKIPTTPTKNSTNILSGSPNKSPNNKIPTTPTKNSTNILSGSPNKSPNKSPKKPMSPFTDKKKKKGFNPKFLDLNNELIVHVCQSKYLSTLLDKEDYRILKHVRNVDANYQFVCFKLYKYKPNWYKLSDFVEKIGLDLVDRDIVSLYEFLKNSDIVDTDYKKENLKVLLEHLSKPDIIKICIALRIRSPTKSTRAANKKEDLIEQILKACRTRTLLTITSSTEDLVRLEIIKNLGKHVVKIKDDFKNSFNRVYILATFTNPHMDDIDQFFKQMMHDNILFPEYDVTEYPVFYSQSEFNSYMEARALRLEMDECTNKKISLKAMGMKIFDKLKAIPQDNEDIERYKDTPHLKRFTAERVYVKCLTDISEKLLTVYTKDAKEWLEYLLGRYPNSRRLGSWYILLIRIHNNLKNREHAGNLLLAAFRAERELLSDIDVQSLVERAEFMKNRINQLQHDNLIEILPIPIKENDFPSNMIDAQAMRGNVSGRKRDYVITDSEGNKTYQSVEDIALDHYCNEAGYTSGVHCEGAIINAVFALFFWDIVYESETVVPGIFLSKYQLCPLDFFTPYFYEHRKESIDQRLKDIGGNWSDEAVLRFVKQHWRLYGHVNSFCQINKSIVDLEFLETVVRCIGRKVLAMIFERLVKDVRQYRSGLPDLFVWNEKEHKCKFIEVKGENDRLSIKQKLWLKYLGSIGADVEVCFVHSIGSKKKVPKKETLKKETPKKKTPRKKTPKGKVANQEAVEKTDDSSSTTNSPKKSITLNKADSISSTPSKPTSSECPSDYDSDFEIKSPSTTPSTSPKKKRKTDPQVNEENETDNSIYDPGPSTSTSNLSPSTSNSNKRSHTENDEETGSPFKKNKSLANSKTGVKKLF